MELLEWVQASIGWAVLAARAARPLAPTPAIVNVAECDAPVCAPLRLRATITIDIDVHDLDQAQERSEAIRSQFEVLKRDHPSAELTFQRRKPRTGRRPPAPSLVVAPYADD